MDKKPKSVFVVFAAAIILTDYSSSLFGTYCLKSNSAFSKYVHNMKEIYLVVKKWAHKYVFICYETLTLKCHIIRKIRRYMNLSN